MPAPTLNNIAKSEELAVELDLIAKRDPSEAGKLEHQVAEELDREPPRNQ